MRTLQFVRRLLRLLLEEPQQETTEGARLARVSASMATAAGWFFTRHPFSGGVSRMSGITSAIASSGTAWVGSSNL